MKAGETAKTECSHDMSYVCENEQCVDNLDGSLTCIDPYVSSGNLPIKSTLANDCSGSTKTASFVHHYEFAGLTCSSGSNTDVYCKSNLGDAAGAEYLKQAKAIIGKD